MEKFGRLVWKILHYIADTDLKYNSKKNLIYDICKIYPCLDCQIDFLEKFHDIITIDICLKEWLYNYHNHINQILNKPIFIPDFHSKLWYSSLNKYEIMIYIKYLLLNVSDNLINNIIILNIIRELNNMFNTSFICSIDRKELLSYINYKINKLENIKVLYYHNHLYFIKKIKKLDKKTIIETNQNIILELETNNINILNYLEYTFDHI